jgi:hypothetical protein
VPKGLQKQKTAQQTIRIDGQKFFKSKERRGISLASKEEKIIKESMLMETEKKKKGLFATIWESMTKTGGCCGGGKSCGGPSNEDDKKTRKKKSSCDEEKRK